VNKLHPAGLSAEMQCAGILTLRDDAFALVDVALISRYVERDGRLQADGTGFKFVSADGCALFASLLSN
jgi:hypothetical protein